MDTILSTDDIDKAMCILRKELLSRHNYLWKTKNGELINIRDMSESHIKNTIRMLDNLKYIRENVSGGIEY